MSEQYSSIARFYDRLGQQPDFAAYADFVLSECGKRGLFSPYILDLACGTGALTFELAGRLGASNVVGVDISTDMLSEASRKWKHGFSPPPLLCQDMRNLSLGVNADAIVCATDSLNYLTVGGDLAAATNAVSANLRDGGLFIFDLNSRYTFEHVYGDRDYVLEEEGILCAWRNYYNPRTHICDFEFDIFEKMRDGKYVRHTEHQRERYFPRRTVKTALQNAGFTLISAASDMSGAPIFSDSRREYYVAVKKF